MILFSFSSQIILSCSISPLTHLTVSPLSGGGGCFLHLLAALPQPAVDVRGGDSVRGLDPPSPAGQMIPPTRSVLHISVTPGAACLVHGLRSLLLLQLHPQPHPLQHHVQEV